MKITNKRKMIFRIIEILIIIATICLTKYSINWANEARGYVANGGEYLIPILGLALLLILEEKTNEK